MSWVGADLSWIIIIGVIFALFVFLALWRRPRKKIRRYRRHIYLIGDTHFDHTNILKAKYSNRPFSNVQAMNWALVNNWNKTVKPKDTVHFLGDWTIKRHPRRARYWMRKLNGHIISIKGNHDKGQRGIRFYHHKIRHWGRYNFLLLHDPKEKQKSWEGWLIHGHTHNKSRKYPFINGKLKTINVSVELINYRPVSIDYILSLNIDSIRRMETINSKPERW